MEFFVLKFLFKLTKVEYFEGYYSLALSINGLEDHSNGSSSQVFRYSIAIEPKFSGFVVLKFQKLRSDGLVLFEQTVKLHTMHLLQFRITSNLISLTLCAIK
jgi:hypothetical protein